jgi:hypothetical protein
VPTSWCRQRDGAAEVVVDELELLLCAVRSMLRKKSSLVLGLHVGVTQLLDVIDLQHLAHHLLTPELPERLEVEMLKPLVPTPGLIILMSDKAEGRVTSM